MDIDRKKIEIIMARKELTLTELSKKTGLRCQYLSRVIGRECGEPKTVGRLARGLGVDATDILRSAAYDG
jgi:lambda repressor-like predicted transcriptional regulator